ncbi:hypothetical protein M514_22751 [Trichuris suis]|uniref:Uncharacterized protein n=1 Tax=Trichuris suis TaxID=68888 RepID=A0A085N6D8_9BILA|nr:hypothetical protein M514_22751 [Trichuris suis]
MRSASSLLKRETVTTFGESLILHAVPTIISAMTTINAREILQSIPLSNSTVSRRIDEMAEDIEEQLVCLLQSKKFSLQLDETLLQDNAALLMAYVPFRDGTDLTEEMLFARRIKTDVTGLSIFAEMKGYLREKNIPVENITACACKRFVSLSVGMRLVEARRLGVHCHCLSKHKVNGSCPIPLEKQRCQTDPSCKYRHHEFLLRQRRGKTRISERAREEKGYVCNDTGHHLELLRVFVQGPKKTVLTTALIDSVCSRTFVDEDLAKKLGLKV